MKTLIEAVEIGGCNIVSPVGASSSPNDIVLRNQYAYISAGPGGLQIFDVSKQSQPVSVGNYTNAYALNLKLSSNYGFLATYLGGLQILDLSNVNDVRLINTHALGISFWEVAIAGNKIYARAGETTFSERIDIIDANSFSNLLKRHKH